MTGFKLNANPKRVAAAASALAVIGLAVWLLAAWWANQTVVAALQSVERAAARGVSSSEVITFTKLLDRTASARALMGQYFINSETVVNLLSDLDQFGAAAGAAVEVTEVAEDQELYLTVAATGSFDAVNRFVSLVERSPYLIEITSLRFSYGVPTKDGQQADGAAWTVKLELLVKSFTSGR